MTNTIKTREHHGADSLDITIPTELVRELDINAGDIFEVEHSANGNIVLKYRRVYESEG